MLWFWYCTNKRWAEQRHAMMGVNPTVHRLLMRMFYPL
jgi:hypothetical protein